MRNATEYQINHAQNWAPEWTFGVSPRCGLPHAAAKFQQSVERLKTYDDK